GPSGFAVNDFNKAGKLAAALLQASRAQIIVMYGAGTGRLTASAPITVAADPGSVFTADFNLDGNLDLAVAHGDDSLTLLFGDGGGGFSPAPGSPISGAAALTATDLTGDGIRDLGSTNRVAIG